MLPTSVRPLLVGRPTKNGKAKAKTAKSKAEVDGAGPSSFNRKRKLSGIEYKVGMVVRSSSVPEWGTGTIVKVVGTIITVDFQNAGQREMDSTIAPLEFVADNKARIQAEAYAVYFARPGKLFSVKHLRKKGLPPSSPGVYGWYFKDPPDYVPTKDCSHKRVYFKKWSLLYIGQAKKLRKRIMDYHIDGKHYEEAMSSFRLSLGCLLSKELGLLLHYPPESFGKKGKKLNKWLEKHARVAWMETENIDALESRAIHEYVLPLNHKYNQHPLKTPLSNLRSDFRSIAKNSVRKPKRRYFKKAYKKFVKQCRAIGIQKHP